jgi:thiol-disulfide isomerase/thioredoxin
MKKLFCDKTKKPMNSLIVFVGCSLMLGLAPSAFSKAKPKEEPAAATEGNSPEDLDKANAKAKKNYEITDNYVQNWLKFPSLSGKSIFNSENLEFVAKKGQAAVVIFLASWCIPCQQVIPEIRAIEDKYTNLNTKFIYVFVNDTREDARGFSKEHKIKHNAVLANTDIKRDFHNPELPSVYLADRRGWLANRYLKSSSKDLAQLNNFLKLITAY